jgi:hypothetical protein
MMNQKRNLKRRTSRWRLVVFVYLIAAASRMQETISSRVKAHQTQTWKVFMKTEGKPRSLAIATKVAEKFWI